LEQGVEYAILDDHHILNAGVNEKEVCRPFRVRGRKGALTLLPALRELRYMMPFRPPGAVAGHLKERAEKAPEGHGCFIFADDGEKFGAWPRTYRWVHKRGWLDSFFELLNSGSTGLKTLLCSEVLDKTEPVELKGIPPSGYPEIMDWSDGDFLNFLDKYPEAARMRERMLAVSERISGYERSGGQDRGAAGELMKAQTGCAYWHGTFGGVYLPHMRDGVYRHLIRAENILDRAASGAAGVVAAVETDRADGERVTRLRNRHLDVFMRAAGGGVVYELDDKKRCSNLFNSMTRVREGYHNKLERGYREKINEARKAALRGEYPDIHDILGIGERGLPDRPDYDDGKKDSFITHIAAPNTPLSRLARGEGSRIFRNGDYGMEIEEEGGFITAVFSKRAYFFREKNRGSDLEVIKQVTVGSGPSVKFSHEVIDRAGDHADLRTAIEFNVLVNDRRFMAGPKSLRSDRISLRDMYSGAVTEFCADRCTEIMVHPIFTVNETESGLRKTFQGMSVLFGVPVEQEHDEREGSSLQISLVLG
jgi:alpha-amylase